MKTSFFGIVIGDTFRVSAKWLWHASHGIRWRLSLSSLLGIIRVAAGLGFIYVSKLLVDMATHRLQGDSHDMVSLGIVMVMLMLLQIGTGAFSSWFSMQTQIMMSNRNRNRIYTHLMHSQWLGKGRLHSGDVLNRLEEDVRVITSTLCGSLPQVLVTTVQLIAAFVFLSRLSMVMACSIALIMPFFLLFSKIYVRTVRRLTKQIRDTDSIVQSHLQESIQHHVLIQSMEQSGIMSDRLHGMQDTLYRQTMHRTRFSIFSRIMVTLGFAAGYLAAFIWSIIQLDAGTITFGTMTAFLQLVSQIQNPAVGLSQLIPSFIHASTSVDRLRELEEIPSEEGLDKKLISGVVGIRLSDVTFRYPDGDRNILQHFSHDFRPGSRTAIVGETGAGKSTMIRLMLSLLRPDAGSISLYNAAGESLSAQAETRCNMVYVPQGNSLLSGTIRQNLLLGNPDATEEQMYEALHRASADFVRDLNMGLQTVCGEYGEGLSEGQAQRIAIARGLLRPGSILLLDEFSSSLDMDTEQTLIHNLIQTCQDKTMIFITHRNMIIDYCDEVIKMQSL